MKEEYLYILSGVIFLFLLITYNPSLGQIYVAMAVLSYILYKSEGFRSFPLVKNNWLMSVAIGAGAYFVFIQITSWILNQFGFVNYNMFSISASILATLVLSGSVYVTLAAFGFAIPFIETSFFTRLFEWFSSIFGRSYTIGGAWSIIFILAGIAVWFHTQAKGVKNNSDLIAVFIFFAFSLIMVVVFQETLSAIVLHIISNSVAIAYIKGITFSSIILNPVFIAIAIGIYFLSKQRFLNRVVG